jgi:hypothetical protein
MVVVVVQGKGMQNPFVLSEVLLFCVSGGAV